MISQRYLLVVSVMLLAATGCNRPSNSIIPEPGLTVAPDTSTGSPVVSDTIPPTTQGVETLTDTAVPQATIAQTDTLPPIQSPLPAVTIAPASGSIAGEHLVVSGETLSCIGRAYGVVPNAIADANGIQLTSILVVGQRLKIPVVQWTNIPPGPVCSPQFSPPFAGGQSGSSSNSQPEAETVVPPDEPTSTRTTTPPPPTDTETIIAPEPPPCTPDTGVTAVPGDC